MKNPETKNSEVNVYISAKELKVAINVVLSPLPDKLK